jgi:ADP-heptose:LPS heptosyltransferase
VTGHVLAVRSDSLGDVLLMGPALRAIAARARVTLLCGPRGEAAARMLPGVAEVVVAELPWIDPEPGPVVEREMLDLVDGLRALGAGEAVVFTSFHQSPLPLALLLRMAGLRRISAISEDYPGSLLDVRHRLPGGSELHEVERALSLAEAAGYPLPPGDEARLAVQLDAPLPAEVAALDGYVVVVPGASVPARAWAPERHAGLVRCLRAAGRAVVVTGTREEAGLTAQVAGPGEAALDLGGRLSFAELGRVLAGADAVVSGNTGPAHLAAAVGTPVVSLFSPVVPAARWRPWRVPHVLLGDQGAPCAGTRARACPIDGHPCLNSVTPEEVAAAVASLAARERSRAGAA